MTPFDIDVSALPEEHREWVTLAVKVANDNLGTGEELSPIAIVHSTQRDALNVISTHFDSEEAKDAFAHYLRNACQRAQADALLFVSEAWSLETDKMDRYEQIIEKYGSIGQSPYKIDCVMLLLETASLSYMCTVPIVFRAPSKKRRRLKGPARFLVATAQGRFSQMLSDTASKQRKH